MRMASHQFIAEPIEHLINAEVSLFVRHLRIKQDLQQQITQLSGQFFEVAIIDGFQYLVRLFQGVGLDGIKALFAVPRTSSRTAQSRHDGNSAFEPFSRCWHGI